MKNFNFIPIYKIDLNTELETIEGNNKENDNKDNDKINTEINNTEENILKSFKYSSLGESSIEPFIVSPGKKLNLFKLICILNFPRFSLLFSCLFPILF